MAVQVWASKSLTMKKLHGDNFANASLLEPGDGDRASPCNRHTRSEEGQRSASGHVFLNLRREEDNRKF